MKFKTLEDSELPSSLLSCLNHETYFHVSLIKCSTLDRRRMGEFFMQVCEHHKLPQPKQRLFRNMELVDFLYKPVSFNSICYKYISDILLFIVSTHLRCMVY